jgi:hypothetical protein
MSELMGKLSQPGRAGGRPDDVPEVGNLTQWCPARTRGPTAGPPRGEERFVGFFNRRDDEDCDRHGPPIPVLDLNDH